METNSINARIAALIDADPRELVYRVQRLSAEHDRIKAGVEHLEHMRKVVLAEQHETARHEMVQRGEKPTEARLENIARQSVAYRNHLAQLLDAKERLATLTADYFAARNALEWCERRLSFAQSEMRMDR